MVWSCWDLCSFPKTVIYWLEHVLRRYFIGLVYGINHYCFHYTKDSRYKNKLSLILWYLLQWIGVSSIKRRLRPDDNEFDQNLLEILNIDYHQIPQEPNYSNKHNEWSEEVNPRKDQNDKYFISVRSNLIYSEHVISNTSSFPSNSDIPLNISAKFIEARWRFT